MEAQRLPLWAPWRMEYVRGAGEPACIFCEPAEPTSDRERLIVHRGAHCFVLLNRYPYSGGHLMVAPYRHGSAFDDLQEAEALETHRRHPSCAIARMHLAIHARREPDISPACRAAFLTYPNRL